MMPSFNLTDDLKTTLLLCGRFDPNAAEDAVKPLSGREFSRLEQGLEDAELRLIDLLEPAGREALRVVPPSKLDPARIEALLDRGAELAFAVEKIASQGLWIVGRDDALYPRRLVERLGPAGPPLMYGAGNGAYEDRIGAAAVGSRDLDEAGTTFARDLGAHCGAHGLALISGGAKGVDQTAMLGALDAGGMVVGVLADGLARAAASKAYRDAILDGRLTLLSPYHPTARFTAGAAMGRNKLIYALADFAVVVSVEAGRGGTWTGAREELTREDGIPVFVRTGAEPSAGATELIKLGARPCPPQPWTESLAETVRRATETAALKPSQGTLF